MLFKLFKSSTCLSFLTAVSLLAGVFNSCSNNSPKKERTKEDRITENQLAHFSTELINKTEIAIADYETQDLAGGVDGFNLRKVFPEFEPQDFIGVRGREGDYSVREGELNFTGNAASTSAVLTKEGFKTLLENCSKRLKIPVTTLRDIDIIIFKLSGSDITSSSGKNATAFSWDAIYEKYLPENLRDYVTKEYPDWSIPDRYRWHPKLFDKYRTDSTVAPIISGDFDCNGKRDYALLMERDKKELAVMVFLGNEQSFSTKILTKNLVHEVPKIEYVLSVVKPGVYKTIDPDIMTDPQSVRLQCASVGIGLFKELYDGGKDVYYFINGELRSCLMEN